MVPVLGVGDVVFTGSTKVAKTINCALAIKDGPITPLITDTGGINEILVRRSGLAERVVETAM